MLRKDKEGFSSTENIATTEEVTQEIKINHIFEDRHFDESVEKMKQRIREQLEQHRNRIM